MKAAADPNYTLHPIEQRILEHWASRADFFGWSRTASLVVNLLSLRECPLTVEAIGKTLKLSRGTLSPALREALSIGAIRSTRRPGSKREYYEFAVEGGHHGLAWLEWRIVRRARMIVEPSLGFYGDLLRDHGRELSPVVRRRLKEVLESFQMERDLLGAYVTLIHSCQIETVEQAIAHVKKMADSMK